MLRTMPGRTVVAVLVLAGAGVLVEPPALASGGRVPIRPTLQRDWPRAVPVPVATITGTSGLRPSETVGLLAGLGRPGRPKGRGALHLARLQAGGQQHVRLYASPGPDHGEPAQP